MKTITNIQDGAASLTVDGRYFPLTIYTWHGVTEKLAIEQAKARLDFDVLARAEGVKLIVVNDLTHFGMPSSPIRKIIGDGAAKVEFSPAMFQYVTIVPSAIIRGAVTAMQWLVNARGKGAPNTNVANVQSALKVAVDEYKKIGVNLPGLDPDRYMQPSAIHSSAA